MVTILSGAAPYPGRAEEPASTDWPPALPAPVVDTAITEEPSSVPVAPRSLSPAERESIRLVAHYLQAGPEVLWQALAEDAPLRALGHDAALAEIKVRVGPSNGAHWTLRTPGPRHGAEIAIFSVEYPSGLEDTLSFEIADQGGALRLLGLSCLVDPRAPATPFPFQPAPLTTPTSAALLPSAGPRLGGSALAFALTLAAGALLSLAPSGRTRALLALVVGSGAVLVACRGASKPQVIAASKALAKVELLASLLPLREALAGSLGADRAVLYQQLPASGVASDAGHIWHADELLRSGLLNEAAAELAAVAAAANYPLAALVRGRLAFLRADAQSTNQAFDQALDQGPDHDGLRIEAAQSASLLGDEFAIDVALQQAGEMGSRAIEVYYGLAAIELAADHEAVAEERFRAAWKLQPIEREVLLGYAGLAAICARPAVFDLLALNQSVELAPAPAALGRAALAWPAAATLRLTGERLTADIAGARLEVPGGAELAPVGSSLEAPADKREREEAEVLARLPALEANAAAGGWSRLALRRDIELAGVALARQQRWADLLRLTENVPQALDRAGAGLVQLRALALRRSARAAEARDLLVRLAKGDMANKRRNPQPLFQLAELMADEGETELAIRLYRRAQALSPLRGAGARIRQLEMERRLAENAQVQKTKHFVLRYPRRVTGEKFAEQLNAVLEQEWQRLQRWVPLAHPERVNVDLFELREFLNGYSAGIPVLGIFDGHVRVPLADLHSLHPQLVAILSHELTHALIDQRTREHSSKWLHEGLAQHAQMSDQVVNPFPELVKVKRQLSLPVVEAALLGFSEPQFVDIAYGQAAWTVHFIEAKWGGAGLRRLLDAYASGQSGEAPLRSAFGLGYAEFDQALWRWATADAPLSWPTELRRYDRETERAELLRKDPEEKRFTIVEPAPVPSREQQRMAAMKAWYTSYSQRVLGVKKSLATVLAISREGTKQHPGQACLDLSAKLIRLLEDPAALKAPEAAVADPLGRGYAGLLRMSTACEDGGESMTQALQQAESALGEAAVAMQPWNMKP